jgi:CO dehydrogenase maturation factor
MGYTIAITGKGGTGKTTLAALIIRIIKEKQLGSILAVDADPNSNLAEALGIEVKETIGSILDEISAQPEKIPSGMPKDRFIEYRLQTGIAEGDGVDLLAMGRPEGAGCYCYVNNILRNIVGKLIKDYDYIVIDNEAGLEHLSRRTTRNADLLLVISDATPVGLRSAKRINELAEELKIKIKKRFLIINRFNDSIDKKVIQGLSLECAGNIPVDKNIAKASLNGNSLMELKNNSISLTALRKIGEKIWQKN